MAVWGHVYGLLFSKLLPQIFNQNITCRTSFSDQVSTIFFVFSVPLFPRLFSQNRSLTWMFANHLFRNVVSNDSWWLQNKTYFWVHWKLNWILLFLSTFRHVMKLKMSIKTGKSPRPPKDFCRKCVCAIMAFPWQTRAPWRPIDRRRCDSQRPGFLKMYRVGQNYL